jgi:tetratricopeptide (TPR) repeat protein
MWNFQAAEVEFRRAIELDPKDAQTHHWYATSLLSIGRYSDALREIEVARQLQPDSVAILANRGFILRTIDPNQSLSALLEVERTAPEFAYVHRYLALVRMDLGQDEEFLTELAAYEQLKHRSSEVAATARAANALTRHGHEAMLTSLAESYGRLAETPDSPDAMDAALFYARLKDAPHTLQYLELSCSRHESNFRVLANEPDYRFLLGNPEFETLVTRSRTPLTIHPTRREPQVGMRQDPA